MNPLYNDYLQTWKHSRLDTLKEGLPTTVKAFKKLGYIEMMELRQKHPELYQQLVNAAKDTDKGRW